MKKLLLVLSLAILGCNLPVLPLTSNPSSNTTRATSTPTLPAPTPALATPPALGTKENPLILALAPSSHTDPEVITAGDSIAAFIEERTGYHVVTIVPPSEASLIDALDKGNAHIAMLSPFGYALARQNNSVTAIMASTRDNQVVYGAQFIANRDSEFIPFYDPIRQENTADADVALKQFRDKKPCWSDSKSPSGYIVPLAFLNENKVRIPVGAFLEGQANVVRAVYAGDICNFGATYVDARALPALETNYPDVSKRVVVIWRIPNMIPYDNISTSNALPIEVRRIIQRAFVDMLLSEDEKPALQTVYGMDEMQVTNDSVYADFERYVKLSGLDLSQLIE